MTYRGHVKNGVVVLDEHVALPEGVVVHVDVMAASSVGGAGVPAATLFERLSSVAGRATGLPPDAAQNVDHYLYGHPKT